MTKRFIKAFYLCSNCYNYIDFFNSLIINKPNTSKRHLSTRFWLDKNYICNETLRIIQLFEDSSSNEENLKILKT